MDKHNYSVIKKCSDWSHSEIYRVAKIMFTHNFDHPLYSTRWALSDWFQFLIENTVLSGGDASDLIKILFRIFRVYQKSEENVDFTLYYDIS